MCSISLYILLKKITSQLLIHILDHKQSHLITEKPMLQHILMSSYFTLIINKITRILKISTLHKILLFLYGELLKLVSVMQEDECGFSVVEYNLHFLKEISFCIFEKNKKLFYLGTLQKEKLPFHPLWEMDHHSLAHSKS